MLVWTCADGVNTARAPSSLPSLVHGACRLGFAVDLDSGGDFLGRDAVVEAKASKGGAVAHAAPRRLASFVFEEECATLPWGGEPIYRDGVMVGKTTSAGFGFTLGRSVALGHVPQRRRALNRARLASICAQTL